MSRHLIYKQKVVLNIPKRESALAYQDRVSDMLQNQLKDSMQAVFDQAFPSNEIIRIDLLQIDLGTISAQNFDQEFKAQFISALTKSLSSKNADVRGSPGKENGEILSNAQSLVNALMFFLEKGYLPWYRSAENNADWEVEIENSFGEREYSLLIDWLRDNHRESPVIIQRLVSQFSDKFIEGLLLKIAPYFDDSWKLTYEDFVSVLNIAYAGVSKSAGEEARASRSVDSPKVEDFDTQTRKGNTGVDEILMRQKIWQYAFTVLLDKKDGDAAFTILTLLINHFGIEYFGEHITTLKEIKTNKGLKTSSVRQAFNKIVSLSKSTAESHKNTGTDSKTNNTTAENAADENTVRDSTGNLKDIKTNTSKNKKKELTSDKDVIYVNNSGIVLLHPFLKAYFESLGLCADRKFIDDSARQRAVLLLHYLATGSTEAAEFDLALEKIMCGYPREETLPASIRLSKKEKEESKNLLLSLISHWPPLKTTSVAGLRETFLQRSGKLESKENGWLLTIEQKTLDILLGKLPWGFSTIRLPWMTDMLNVDWY